MSEEIEVLKEQSSKVAQWAAELQIVNKADADMALTGLQRMKSVRAKWVAYWKPIKDAAAAAHKGICAKEKEGTEGIDVAEAIVKRKVLTWQQAENEKAAIEQRRLQSISDEQARKDRERLEAQAAKLKTPEKAQERLEQAAAIVAPVITVTPDIKTAGVSTVKTWKAELISITELTGLHVTDLRLPFLEFNQQSADRFAKATKGAIPVAGVRFVEIESLSVRKQ